ncbi:MAG: hypothetical protein ACOC6Q_02480 [Patescibacteria group bacterium]
MKINTEHKLKSIVTTIENILAIGEELENLEGKNKQPEFLIENIKENRKYTLTTKEELQKKLESTNLNELGELELRYWGNNQYIDIHYSSWRIQLHIKSTNRETLLPLEEDLKKLIGNPTWNWVIHNPWFGLVITGVIQLLIFIPVMLFGTSDFLIALPAVFLTGMVISPLIESILKKRYPKFVIIDKAKERKKGRLLKKDLLKLLGFVTLGIALPKLIEVII